MDKISNKRCSPVLLSKNSHYRKEAEGMLRYAFHVDFDVPTINMNDPNLIDALKDVCGSACTQLTNDYDLSFFGKNYQADELSTINNETILNDNIRILYKSQKELLPNQRKQLNNTKIRYTCLRDIIINDSILEAFHILLYTLLNGISFPAYSIFGVRDIYDVILCSSELNLNSYARKNGISKNGGHVSDFNGKWTNISSIPVFKHLVYSAGSINAGNRYYPMYSSIYNRLSNVNISHLKHAFNPSLEYRLSNLNALHEIHTVLMPSEKDNINNEFKHHNNVVDSIYHYYLSEKLTNIGLFYSIIDNIKSVERRTNYRFSNKETLAILSKLSILPNVFGRIPLVRYAFDYIDPDTYSGADLLNNMELSESLLLGMKNPIIPVKSKYTSFSFERWLTQIDFMTCFLSKLLIPACSWCFLLMLLQIIEDNLKDDPYDIQRIYKKAISILGTYITKNKEVIMHPIILQNKSRNIGLDLFTWDPEWNISFADMDCIPLLYGEFFKSGNKANLEISSISHDILVSDDIETVRYLRAHNSKVLYGIYMHETT